MRAKDQAYQPRQGGRYQIDPETGKRVRMSEPETAAASKPGTKSGTKTGTPVKTEKEA